MNGMMPELVAELAALAASQGWEFVGLATDGSGQKVIGLRRSDGEAVQVTLTPGRADHRAD